MNISKVTDKDVKELFHFIRKTFSDTYAVHNTPENLHQYLSENLSDEQLFKKINSPQCHFYKGVVNGDLMAYLKLNTNNAQTDLTDINAIEIERIYVDKSFHRKGFGAELIAHSIKIGRQLKKSYLWLGVWDQNTKAIAFYKNMGFEIFDTHDFQFGSDLQTDFMMKVEL